MQGSTPVSARLAPFGTTIFAEISSRARAACAVDLGQGAPDFDGPDFIKEAAARAMRDHPNQYAPLPGVLSLRQALAERWHKDTGQEVSPDTEITITAGCTEAIPASMLGLLEPGDHVVVFEPFYDSYPAAIAITGAVPRFVALRAQEDGSFAYAPEELARACEGARAIIINTPHNPTGKVFTPAELAQIADLADRHDLIILADEVYDRLVFDGAHTPIASIDHARARTVTMGSLGKTFSLTGWKIGWTIAPPDLTKGIRSAHQFLTYAVATPLQHAAAEALRVDDGFYSDFVHSYRARRGRLAEALTAAGFRFALPAGGYFILADHTAVSEPLGLADDVELCHHMIDTIGVATIPPTAFYRDKSLGRHLLRFAFCKRMETLEAAADRLARLGGG